MASAFDIYGSENEIYKIKRNPALKYYKDFFIVVQLIIITYRGRWTGWKNMKFYENLNGNQITRK